MRILLCCGDRNWDNFALVLKTIRKEHQKRPITYLVEGGQESEYQGSWGEPSHKGKYGGDYQAKQAALILGIQIVECPALWQYYKKAAGPIRNQMQLNLAIKLAGSPKNLLVIAFHSDIEKSKGTKDMVKRAKKAEVKVRIIK